MPGVAPPTPRRATTPYAATRLATGSLVRQRYLPFDTPIARLEFLHPVASWMAAKRAAMS